MIKTLQITKNIEIIFDFIKDFHCSIFTLDIGYDKIELNDNDIKLDIFFNIALFRKFLWEFKVRKSYG